MVFQAFCLIFSHTLQMQSHNSPKIDTKNPTNYMENSLFSSYIDFFPLAFGILPDNIQTLHPFHTEICMDIQRFISFPYCKPNKKHL